MIYVVIRTIEHPNQINYPEIAIVIVLFPPGSNQSESVLYKITRACLQEDRKLHKKVTQFHWVSVLNSQNNVPIPFSFWVSWWWPPASWVSSMPRWPVTPPPWRAPCTTGASRSGSPCRDVGPGNSDWGEPANIYLSTVQLLKVHGDSQLNWSRIFF